MNKIDITKAALIGQAVGDAFGVPVEFMRRKEVRAIKLTEMVGKDTNMGFHSRWGSIIPAGAWSDDTSMTIAAMNSIAFNKAINYEDIMNQFIRWWVDKEYCALEFPFGLGSTVFEAIRRYVMKKNRAIKCGPAGIMDNGNGSLMRILPFSLYCIFTNADTMQTLSIINHGSSITHGHAISKMGCFIFTLFLQNLINEDSIDKAWEVTRKFDYSKYYNSQATDAYQTLLAENFAEMNDSVIGETGYVVDTLMAAVYSMLHGHDYESSILCAVNMGYDTDTNAAVTGALAGAFYGLDKIPDRWLKPLKRRDMLESIAARFAYCFGE